MLRSSHRWERWGNCNWFPLPTVTHCLIIYVLFIFLTKQTFSLSLSLLSCGILYFLFVAICRWNALTAFIYYYLGLRWSYGRRIAENWQSQRHLDYTVDGGVCVCLGRMERQLVGWGAWVSHVSPSASGQNVTTSRLDGVNDGSVNRK